MKEKKILCVAIATTILLVLFGFAIACNDSSPEEVDNPTVEYQLAVINEGGYVEEDDPVVYEFKVLVESIDSKVVEGPTEIGDILVTAQEILRDKYKIRMSLLVLARDLDESVPEDVPNLKFEEIAVAYITILGESQ